MHHQEKALNKKGICIGKPLKGVELNIIAHTDKNINDYHEVKKLSSNHIGEIIVKGENVTSQYVLDLKKTLATKIKDNQGFWHRMGDMGYQDEEGFILVLRKMCS